MLLLTLGLLAVTLASVVIANLVPAGLLSDCALIVGASTGLFCAAMIFLLIVQAISPMRDEDESETPATPPAQRRKAA